MGIYNDKLKYQQQIIHGYTFFFSIKEGKTEVENFDLKDKLNIVSGIIANAKKDLESQNHLKPRLTMLKVIVQYLKRI